MRYKILIIVFITVFSFSSCNFLDVDPTNSIPAENAFTTEKGLIAALHGAYSGLQGGSITIDVTLFPEVAADNLVDNGSKVEYGEVSDNRITPDNTYVEAIWRNCYVGINRVNNILLNIDKVEGVSQEDYNSYLGQAYFLRAYYYFTLVKFFGGVPVRTEPISGITPEELNIPRATEEEVYNLVISDLEEAESLTDGLGIGLSAYAGEGAVKAFLARVYLYTENWQAAADMAQEVIDMGYVLETDFANIFDEGMNSDEIIYEIDFVNDPEGSNGLANWCLPSALLGRGEVAAWNDNERTSSIADDFNSADLRYDATIIESNGEYFCGKYTDIGTAKDNLIVFRLAEMYLIGAEALNELGFVAEGEAFSLLNEIRQRAGLTNLTSIDAPDQDAFREAVVNERRFELAFEGHRLFDLKRTNLADLILPDIGTLKNAGWLFPIPQAELDANESDGMSQNSGY
jgi:hypothetical protein